MMASGVAKWYKKLQGILVQIACPQVNGNALCAQFENNK